MPPQPEISEKSLAILKTKYLLSPITYEGIHRRERLEYPYEALREAIFNALIHRDYNTTSAIQIKIYNNSLSIANEGKLPPEITIADLKREHLSKPRNKLLADIFYKAGFIESWGRGTLKILRECKEAHIPEPNFYEENGVVKIIFELAGGNNTRQHEGVSEGVVEGVGEGVKDLFLIIKENPGQRVPFLSKKIQKPGKTIERWLRSLKGSGKIVFKGNSRTGGYFAN